MTGLLGQEIFRKVIVAGHPVVFFFCKNDSQRPATPRWSRLVSSFNRNKLHFRRQDSAYS